MQTKFKLAVVGLAVLALAACSGNGSSLPGPGQAGQSIIHRGGSMNVGGVDTTKVHIMRTANAPRINFDAPQTLRYVCFLMGELAKILRRQSARRRMTKLLEDWD